ncbi:hypothetical protein AnigIFM60653_004443 [Aspergillus niger]|nr:hypothetical protein AnigIFM60653_004443 [Aspergillus niger]
MSAAINLDQDKMSPPQCRILRPVQPIATAVSRGNGYCVSAGSSTTEVAAASDLPLFSPEPVDDSSIPHASPESY